MARLIGLSANSAPAAASFDHVRRAMDVALMEWANAIRIDVPMLLEKPIAPTVLDVTASWPSRKSTAPPRSRAKRCA